MYVRANTISRAALLLVMGMVSGPGITQPAADGLVPYRAVYAVLNDGRRVGESVHSLSYDPGSRRYVFETRTTFRGLLRLASPRPLIERSEFVVRDGRLQPLTFTYEGGSRSGRNDVQVRFDWPAGRIVASTEDGQREWPLPAGSLDRASARVALMRDAAAVETYQIADPVEVRPYALRREGLDPRTTPLGDLQTIRITLQRPGSTRRTVTWAAPDLHFLAVRIEQQRDGRGPIAFEIESVDWTSAGARAQTDR
jgi:hypothetical protein